MWRALVATSAVVEAQQQTAHLLLDASTALHRYDGHGGLSAGASSRLLWDYQEPYRSQILDYLFKPYFGASLHTLKVEIGGDDQSTDGTEPSHEHYRGDLSCTRGYELWLVQQAKARSPSIQIYGLSWGEPYWVGNGSYYSDDGVSYQVQWVTCMKQQTGYDVDFLGFRNEKPQPDMGYLLELRAALDAAGHTNTKLMSMDGGFATIFFERLQANASAVAAVYGAGLHYPCDTPRPQVRELGLTFWSSEDYSRDPAWTVGGTYWGKALSQNYVLMNMTATIAWSLIWSTYTNFVCNGSGLMRAPEPWSGYYEASAPIWLSAHWTQFMSPGWRFLHVPGGGSGILLDANGTAAGTYVTLVPPASASDASADAATTGAGDFTLILETLNSTACQARNLSDFAVNVTLTGGLAPAGTVLYVWRTTSDAYFVQQPSITVGADGSFAITIPADSMTTVTTLNTGNHGTFPDPVPSSAPFPLPYSDNFENYTYDALAMYFADQGGSWAVRNGSLVQVSPANPGNNAWAVNPDPLTIMGGETWSDYALTATARFSGAPPIPSSQAMSSPSHAARSRAARVTSTPDSARLAAYRDASNAPLAVSVLGDVTAAASRARAGASIDTVDLLVPCASGAPYWGQSWAFDAPAHSYASLATPTGAPLCLNVDDCGDGVVLFACETSGGTCCGANCYKNFQWALNATGNGSAWLTSALDGRCVTANATSPTAFLAPCGTAPNQTWALNASSGQLHLAGSAPPLCLGYAAPQPYVQLCGRITQFNGFRALAPMNGYCVRVDGAGNWALTVSGSPAASGTLAAFDSTQPHALSLSMVGAAITGAIDGVQLAQIADTKFTVGSAALSSGFHTAAFDDFTAVPL